MNTKYTARPDTDGSSEKVKEKSLQEPVPNKMASRWRLLDEKSEVWVPLEKILILQGRSNFIISVLWRVYYTENIAYDEICIRGITIKFDH